MMMKISAMAFVPIMLVAVLLLKPSLVGVGMFVTSLIVELLIIFMMSDYYDND